MTNFSTNKDARFEENIGQFIGDESHRIKFRLNQGANSIFLLDNAIAYQFSRYENLPEMADLLEFNANSFNDVDHSTYRMDLQLIGSNTNPRISKFERSTDYVRYAWTNMDEAYSYSRIVYHEVYDHIDWVFYVSDQGIKYEFVVRPGGDPKQIRFQSLWVENSSIDVSGNLILENRLGTVKENKPVSFQNETAIITEFVLEKDIVSFELDDYNRNETLVIDPQIVWGSYYGGDGADAFYSVTTDTQGNVYTCGTTYGSNTLASGGFLNANPAQFGGAGAVFLVKFDPNGTRLWATYYGGTTSFSGAFSCKTDSQDNIYVVGFTYDLDGIAFNGHQNTKGGNSDAFLVKFNAIGERIWATYFGGTEDESGIGLDIDNSGDVYITGSTFSSSMIGFNGFQNTADANIGLFGSAFLAKFNALGTLLWSTYFGGLMGDRAFSVACAPNGDCYIAGSTYSSSGIANNGHQNTAGLQEDAFLAKYSSSGIPLWSTYYGGSNDDKAYSCAVDNLGNVILSGESSSANNIFFNGFQNSTSSFGGGSFLAKFNPLGTRLWGTYYGSGANEIGYACATDSDNNVFLAGRTQNATGISFQGFQNTFGSTSNLNSDCYIVQFNPSGSRVWASYYGGSSNDFVRGIHVDPADQIYIVGTTQSPNNIFFQGFQSTQQNETGLVAKIGCPSPQILNLPMEVCANSSVQLSVYPPNGTLQLLGPGTLSGNNYTAPNVSTSTSVTLEYAVGGNSSCSSSIETFDFTVLPNVVANASITASSLVICENEPIVFNAAIQNAGTNPMITWLLNNQSVLSNQTTYTSSALSNNDFVQCIIESSNVCATPSVISTNTISITVNPIPNVTLIYSDINGGTLITGAGFGSYEWFLNGNLIPGANSSFYVPLANGDYSVVVTDANGCENSDQYNFQSLSVKESDQERVDIYPIPVENQLNLSFENASNREIFIYNAIGQLILKTVTQEQAVAVDVHDISLGTYTLLINDGDQLIRSKFVVCR